MGSVRARKDNGQLFLDFRYLGERCRERSVLADTKQNRLKLELLMNLIESEIKAGQFCYRNYFPNSSLLEKIEALENHQRMPIPGTVSIPMAQQPVMQPVGPPSSIGHPTFGEFAEKFIAENESIWKRSNLRTKQETLEKWLRPHFGTKVISSITKQDILEFRSVLAKAPGKKPGTTMSASRINHVMTSVSQILSEAADRFNFNTPFQNIKRLRIKKTDVHPFTLEEVELILKYCRPDFRNYFATKFFTGMRPGEIHGLKWKYVDLEKRIITIRETVVEGYEETPKTAGSNRDIRISPQVYEALNAQWEMTGNRSVYVFANANGGPLTNRNMSNRVWYPLLRSLGLKPRTPYQTRHTFATLMLAAGESPEWIAFQMGHSSTEMLFKVYSRYVPNLTRRDGSAFERMLAANFGSPGAPPADHSSQVELPPGAVSNRQRKAQKSEPPIAQQKASRSKAQGSGMDSSNGSSPYEAAQTSDSAVALRTQPMEVQSESEGEVNPIHHGANIDLKNPWLAMFQNYNNKDE
ncbi:site-specific integrase [Limnobacter humi]|uniref:Site-specific integrase n=1 Tax=Limnobacter humi TaxID=1778671 RepID=A0ABT1WE86_9BURK|nr:tyrosine-type recombinase/integrase [Limnobacter humi]MCQ8895694.1 site-specific integrase [Limnobacter humi]